MNNHRNIPFVVFSDDYGRHPSCIQHLFNVISQTHRVLWVNTLGIRQPKANAFTLWRGLSKLKQWLRPLQRINDNLFVLSPIMYPTSGTGPLAALNRAALIFQIRYAMGHLTLHRPVLFSSVPNAADVAGQLGERAIIYCITDNYCQWPASNAAQIDAMEQRLIAASDHVLASSQSLAQRCRRSEYFPHAIDAHWLQPASTCEPDELASIPHPRLCFFGLIYEKIDQEALATLASLRPDLHIVMIGPVATSTQRLAEHANIHFIGPKPYPMLPRYLHAMDAILIPYVLDAETHDKGPLKLRESLATGLPIIARRIPDFETFSDLITLYDCVEELPQAVDDALATRCAELTDARRSRVRCDTWQSRAAHIVDLSSMHTSSHPVIIDGDVRVEIASTLPDWTAFLHTHPDASIFHDPRWNAAIARTYSTHPIWFTARRDTHIVGVLQCTHQRHAILGSRITSLPWFDASGMLVADDAAQAALLAAAERVLARQNVASMELRHRHTIRADLPARTDKVTFLLPLEKNIDVLWQRLDGKVRNLIRRAEKNALTVHINTPTSLDDFYTIYARTMRDLGSPPHSRRWFAEMRAVFDEAIHVFVIQRGSHPLAAGWLVADGQTVRLPWAAADHRHLDTCSNMLLYWSMIAWAGERGYATFDFGRCSRNSGTWRFKQQWGAVETPLYWYQLGRQTLCEAPHRESTPFRLASKCFKYLPVGLAKRIGPLLIRGLA